jgi:hypothetical protein
MMGREDAIAIARKLVCEQQPKTVIVGVDNVFTVDNGQTWTVHLLPQPIVLDEKWVAVDTPGTIPVFVNAKTGQAKIGETL